MELSKVKEKSKELNEDLITILGRPNFACGGIARVLRKKGFECREKSEDEQALVIHTMLTFYNEYGADWAKELNEFLNE